MQKLSGFRAFSAATSAAVSKDLQGVIQDGPKQYHSFRRCPMIKEFKSEVSNGLPSLSAKKMRRYLKENGVTATATVWAAGWNNSLVAVVCYDKMVPYVSCVFQNLTTLLLDPKTGKFVENWTSGKLFWETAPKRTVAMSSQLNSMQMIVNDSAVVANKFINRAVTNMFPGMRIVSLDNSYTCVKQSVFEELLKNDTTDRLTYESELRDCDDFAFMLRTSMSQAGLTGVGVVIDYSAGHAYNVVAMLPDNGKEVDDDNLVLLAALEPQTDKWVSVGQGQFLGTSGYIVL